jgi:hypothetical protein
MPDDENNQNDAGDGDDHFFSNRRAIKSGENIHVSSRAGRAACVSDYG